MKSPFMFFKFRALAEKNIRYFNFPVTSVFKPGHVLGKARPNGEFFEDIWHKLNYWDTKIHMPMIADAIYNEAVYHLENP